MPALNNAGITHILCLGSNMPSQFPSDFEYKVLPYFWSFMHADLCFANIFEIVEVEDKPKARILDQLSACVDFIEEGVAKGGVFVHCFQGKSRSVSIIIGYQVCQQPNHTKTNTIRTTAQSMK